MATRCRRQADYGGRLGRDAYEVHDAGGTEPLVQRLVEAYVC
jgi:hypothetical protein